MYVLCILYSLLSVPAHSKHYHRDYTYSTSHTVYTATKLTTSMYCNYNS